jgi:hypothetical protein
VSTPGYGPGFGLTYSKALNPKLTGIVNYIGGEEPDAGGTSFRNLIDVVALYNPGGKMSYAFNFDFGTQSGDNWYGISAMGKYAINDKQYLAARLEFMNDDGGVRFGTGDETSAYGFTLGYAYNFNKHIQSRLEYRHDFSNRDLFNKEGAGIDDQGRIIFSTILSY